MTEQERISRNAAFAKTRVMLQNAVQWAKSLSVRLDKEQEMSEKLNELKDVMRQNNPRTLNQDDISNIATVKGLGNSFHAFLADLPATRERDIAMGKLEECVMWAVKGISG